MVDARYVDQHRTFFGSDIITIFHFHVEFDHESVKKIIPTYFLSYSAENSAIAQTFQKASF